MTTVQQLTSQLREREGRLRQREEELQQKDTQILQNYADISRLQREIQRLQVDIKIIASYNCVHFPYYVFPFIVFTGVSAESNTTF